MNTGIQNILCSIITIWVIVETAVYYEIIWSALVVVLIFKFLNDVFIVDWCVKCWQIAFMPHPRGVKSGSTMQNNHYIEGNFFVKTLKMQLGLPIFQQNIGNSSIWRTHFLEIFNLKLHFRRFSVVLEIVLHVNFSFCKQNFTYVFYPSKYKKIANRNSKFPVNTWLLVVKLRWHLTHFFELTYVDIYQNTDKRFIKLSIFLVI